MKKFSLVIFLCATILASFSCQKEIVADDSLVESADTYTVTFTAGFDDTKTAFNESQTAAVWSEGDDACFTVYHCYKNSSNQDKAVAATYVSVEFSTPDYKIATITAQFGSLPAGATHVGYKAVFAGDKAQSGNAPLLLAHQKPTSNSFDPHADFLVSDLLVDDSVSEKRFFFHRQASINKMTLRGLAAGSKIDEVVITAQDGKFVPKYTASSSSVDGKDKVITCTYSDAYADENGNFAVYFICGVGEFSAVDFSVFTSDKFYQKKLSDTQTISFGANDYYKFGVTVQPVGQVYKLVESKASINTSDRYVLANENTVNPGGDLASSKVLGKYDTSVSTTYIQGVNIIAKTSTGKKIVVNEQEVTPFKISTETIDKVSGYVLKDLSNNYFGKSTSEKNGLVIGSPAFKLWVIDDITSGGFVQIKNKQDNYVIKYNTSALGFSTYTTGASNVKSVGLYGTSDSVMPVSPSIVCADKLECTSAAQSGTFNVTWVGIDANTRYVLLYSDPLGDNYFVGNWCEVELGNDGNISYSVKENTTDSPRQVYMFIGGFDADNKQYDALVTITQDKSSVVSVTGVSLNKTFASLKVGNTLQLTSTIQPATATNKNVRWSSNNPSVASVESGLVTTHAIGTAVITVTTEDGEKTAQCTVTVEDEPIRERTIPDGEYVIVGIADGGLHGAVKWDGSSNNLKTIPLELQSGKLLYTPDHDKSDVKMTITYQEDGIGAGLYTIKDASNRYLYAVSTQSNYMKAQATPSTNAYWAIVQQQDGSYSIVAEKAESNRRNVMRCNLNNGSPIISCYASSEEQSPVSLYPFSTLEEKEVEPQDPTWEITPSVINVPAGSRTTATITTNYDGAINPVESSNSRVSASIVGSVLTVDATGASVGETAILTITGSKTALYNPLQKTVSVTVISSSMDPGTVLFHESFGNNTSSARNWSASYSVKSGVESVYKDVSYTITNAKQSKNTVGSTQSGLLQTTNGTDAVLVIGPLHVSNCQNMQVTYKWNAVSVKGTYTTKLYYSTTANGSYTEVSGTGNGATSFVTRSYDLPAQAQVSDLYLKVVWNTSKTQALIDEFELKIKSAQ